MAAVRSLETLPRVRRNGRAAALRDFALPRAATTPGRLLLLGVALLAGAVAFGVISTAAERSRAGAAQAVQTKAEPLLVEAVILYTSLSDANATATTTFLRGGLEPPATRAHYLRDLTLASAAVTTLTKALGDTPGSSTSVAQIAQRLPVYSGLVEAARANNRQGLPVGAAYLRQASALLTGKMLPEADRLYATGTQRLTDDYAQASGSTAGVVLAMAVALALGLLVLAQRYLMRISRRVFNVPMVGATLVLAAVSIWALVGILGEGSAIARAQRESDSVGVLSAARVLLSRAQSDQALTLVNRGSDDTDPRDFAAVVRALAPPGGLLGELAVLARRTGTTNDANRLLADFARYRSGTAQTASLQKRGRIVAASDRASSPAARAIADSLQANLVAQTAHAQRRFTAAAADATGSLSGLSVAIPLLTVIAAVIALAGLRQRLGEYR